MKNLGEPSHLTEAAHREEYVRVYSTIGTFKMSEKKYLRNCSKVVRNIVKLKELPKKNSLCRGDFERVKEIQPEIYKFLVKRGIKDVSKFIDEVIQKYRGVLQVEIDNKSTTRNQKMSLIKKRDQAEWFEALIDFCYKEKIGVAINPSKVWIAAIESALYDETVIHHCHYSGKIYGYTHKSCNSQLRTQKDIPVKVYAHNAANFDLLFLVKGFTSSPTMGLIR